MTNLAELQIEWIRLHDQLGDSFDGQLLAAPFFSMPDDSRVEGQERPILLVGQATAGCWGIEDFGKARAKSVRECVAERLSCTAGHLEWRKNADQKPSAFWRFRSGLEQISKVVIWTNLAKIGVQEGNPKWRLVRMQSELACRTLDAEVELYNPSLIVLVTGDFGRHEVVWPMFGRRDAWQSDAVTGYRWQERSVFGIPVLWTGHPGMKLATDLQQWLRKARELYERGGSLHASRISADSPAAPQNR